MRQVRIFIVIAFAAIFLASGSASAVTMHDLSLDPQYQANANDSVGGVFTQDSGGVWHFGSMVNIGNGWGLTAAHAVDYATPYGVYFGENVYSPDYSAFVTDSYIYPDWTGSYSNSHDLALVQFADPLVNVPVATISGAQPDVGDEIHMSGYGRPGTEFNPGTFDGTGRGWDGYVTQFGEPGKAPDNYLTSEWVNPFFSNSHALGGLGSPGDSGGGVFDDTGLLIAIIVGGSGTSDHYGLDTFALGLWEAAVQDWITDTSGIVIGGGASVPEPATLLLFGFGLLGLAGVQRKQTA